MLADIVKATFLGVVEGFTEYLPVSSTGHLLLIAHFFGFREDDFGKSFVILIQFGAILALLSIYFAKLWRLALGMFTNKDDFRFVVGVLIAFLPAGIVGFLIGSWVKLYLFNPWIVSISLIVGGVILLWVDRLDLKPRYFDATKFPLLTYLIIGICQCVSMIPGVSRSGATIVAAMLMGTDRRSAAEFSFWLAMPTMAGAFVYDLYKSGAGFTADNALIIAIGFVTSFVFGWIVVKTFLDYVQRHGLGVFGWWRIIVGAAALAALIAGK